ncbi:MAG: hypothetical protein H6925_00980 [Holosporaceae bacterium]|nr:MAG: hypothetical protein H6925_00980 [Holosporaceae bacterium]
MADCFSFKIFGNPFGLRVLCRQHWVQSPAFLVCQFERNNRETIYFPGIVLASSAGFFLFFLGWFFFDVGLTFFLTGTLLFFWKYFNLRKKLYLHISALFLGGAALFKGFVSIVLVGLVVLTFLLLEKKLKLLLKLLNPVSLLLFLLVTVPWHLLAAQQEQGFSWFYFINEHIMRFLDQRIPKDYYTGPIYYYIPRLILYFLPWAFIWPFLKRFRLANQPLGRFLLCWFFSFLLFFSLSRAKANYYMVVGMPPLALWFGLLLEGVKGRYKILVGGASISALLLFGGLYYARHKEPEITVKDSVARLDVTRNVFLYKRFEELSSLPFYLGRPVLIIHSESRDLWYAQQKMQYSHLFLDKNVLDSSDAYVYVLKRDLLDFESCFRRRSSIKIFSAPKYVVYWCRHN